MTRKKAPETTNPAAAPAPVGATAPESAAPPEPQKEADMAKQKSAKGGSAKKSAPTGKGAIALVTRISKEAHAYLKEKAGEEPVTRVLRKILAAGDARLGKLLGEE